ncbi:MAG TPA: ABC transporter substrate-binding protein [Thermomicrobiales bacterium]|jgi:peptide/nickel transport system substrate-binding protein|nr:ABC transporter substrate-binding protein [Thermomicrobiales bacterium]
MTDTNITRDLLTRKLDRRALVGTSAAGALAVAAWPRHLGAAPVRQEGSTIIIGTLGESTTQNPFAANESESYWRAEMIFDQFVRLDYATGGAAPGLAASWEIEGLTFTFAIQPNARFHDGTDVTADDVKFTLEAILTPETASENANRFAAIYGVPEFQGTGTTEIATPAAGTPAAEFVGASTGVSGIEAVDAKTLRITLARPDASFLYSLHYVFVVPRAQLEGQALDRTSTAPFFSAPIGAGPYVFESWSVGSDFIARANPDYWDTGKPMIQSFTHRAITDSSGIANALQSGEINGSLYASPTLTEQLQAAGNLTIEVPAFAAPNGTVFNCRTPPFDKVEVRRAVAMAVNVDAYVQDSLLGLGEAGLGPIAPALWAHDPTLTPIPYDPEAARAVFEANGMIGQTYEILTNAGNILREDWCIRVQADLQELGVNIQFTPIEYTTVVERINTGQFTLDAGDFAGAALDPNDLYDQFHSKGATNVTGYSDPELDALLEQGRTILDQEEAKPVWSQVQQILMRDVPMHWAWYRPFISVVDNRYTGYTVALGDGGLFRSLPDMTFTEAP